MKTGVNTKSYSPRTRLFAGRRICRNHLVFPKHHAEPRHQRAYDQNSLKHSLLSLLCPTSTESNTHCPGKWIQPTINVSLSLSTRTPSLPRKLTAQVVQPVHVCPPHCPYFATVHPLPPPAVVVVALLEVVVVVVDVLNVVELAAVVDEEPPPTPGVYSVPCAGLWLPAAPTDAA